VGWGFSGRVEAYEAIEAIGRAVDRENRYEARTPITLESRMGFEIVCIDSVLLVIKL